MPIKKSCLMKNKLEDMSVLQMPVKERHHVHTINGNALFYNLSQLQETFGELAYSTIILCPSKSCQSPFLLLDDYKEYSIKSLERIRRGESQTYTYSRLLQNLSSSHEEADTLLILHSVYVDQTINSTDTDIITRSPE